MVRTSNSKRRQICARVKKHKIRSSQDSDAITPIEKFLPREKLMLLYETARKCFYFYGKVCCKLHLAPYSFSPDGKLQHMASRGILIHYAVLTTLALSMMHKVAMLCHCMFRDDADAMDMSAAASIVGVMAYLVPLGATVSILRAKEETVCTVNSWGNLAASSEDDESEQSGIFANVKAAVLVVYLSGVCSFVAIGLSLFGFVFKGLPISYYTTAVQLGLLNNSATAALPPLLWKLGLWPLEFVTYMVPMLMCAWSSFINQLIPIVVNDHLNQLR